MAKTYNTTDNRYTGRSPKMRAAQAMADALRRKYTMPRTEAMQGEAWDRIFAHDERWLDDISVWEDWNGAPAVIWETDTEWAFNFPLGWLEDQGHKFYAEPYYSFAVNIFPI